MPSFSFVAPTPCFAAYSSASARCDGVYEIAMIFFGGVFSTTFGVVVAAFVFGALVVVVT